MEEDRQGCICNHWIIYGCSWVLPKMPRLASSCASAPLVPLFVAARARGQGLDGCLRSLANLECFHIYLAWNNILFVVNTTRKSGKLQVIKRQVVENCFQPCQTQRRQLSPLSATLLLIFFHVRMVAGPLHKAQPRKGEEKNT